MVEFGRVWPWLLGDVSNMTFFNVQFSPDVGMGTTHLYGSGCEGGALWDPSHQGHAHVHCGIQCICTDASHGDVEGGVHTAIWEDKAGLKQHYFVVL